MLTFLLEQIEPLHDDHVIVDSLGLSTSESGLDSVAPPIGIRNTAGQVYRLVQVEGVGEAIRFTRVLQRLGFSEEDHLSHADGCTGTFHRRALAGTARLAQQRRPG